MSEDADAEPSTDDADPATTGEDDADAEPSSDDADAEPSSDDADAEPSSDDADAGTPGEQIAGAFEPVDAHLRRIDWYPIVKKEFSDAIRSRALVVLTVVLLAIFVLPPAIILYTDVGADAGAYTQRLIIGQVEIMALVTSIGGVAFGYASVSGERERGSIKFLLGQPYDRRDVVLGKLFGRFATLTIPLFAVVLLRLVVVAPSGAGDLPLQQYLIFLGLSMLLALVFVSFGVGASAATRTTRKSLVVAGGVWAYLFLLWGSVSRGIPTLWNDLFGLEPVMQTKVELALKLVHPGKAFQTLLSSFTGQGQVAARADMVGSLLLSPQRAVFQRQQIVGQLGDGVPWYLTDWVAIASLVVWLVVPLAVGYWYFNGADL